MKLDCTVKRPKGFRKEAEWQKLIEEFEDSESDFAEVILEDNEYESYQAMLLAARAALKWSGRTRTIKALLRNGHIYLEKIIP